VFAIYRQSGALHIISSNKCKQERREDFSTPVGNEHTETKQKLTGIGKPREY
jgi:hypothetical protein